jgi:pyruvate kinase
MDVARLKFSHGTRDDHAETARRVREAAGRAGRQVAILQDLPGPKLRIGELVDDLAELKPGEVVTFVCGHEGVGDAARMYIAWHGVADSVQRDEIVYRSDGRIRLRVTATRPGDGEFDAVVEIGGAVSSRQGSTSPGAPPCPWRPRWISSTFASARGSGSISSRCPSCAAPMTSPPCAPTHGCR